MQSTKAVSRDYCYRGVVFVEFALVVVFLVPLLILTIDISHALYEYQTLVKQVRAGARYLSVQPPMSSADPATPTTKLKANCLVRTSVLEVTCSHPPLLPQLANSSLVVINDSETLPASLKSLETTPSGSVEYSTNVNLVEVKIVGYVHNLFSGLTTIQFPPIVSRMRQTN